MLLRFSIELRHLTDAAGKPIPRDTPGISYLVREAESADEAVQGYVTETSAELIGNVLKFPGFQAVATVRQSDGVYTMQVSPASGVGV